MKNHHVGNILYFFYPPNIRKSKIPSEQCNIYGYFSQVLIKESTDCWDHFGNVPFSKLREFHDFPGDI